MFKFFIENKLISLNQSGFKPDDSCINQLLAVLIIYMNQLMMDFNFDVSKAFDKVWHECLIFKFKKKLYLAIY